MKLFIMVRIPTSRKHHSCPSHQRVNRVFQTLFHHFISLAKLGGSVGTWAVLATVFLLMLWPPALVLIVQARKRRLQQITTAQMRMREREMLFRG